MFFPTHRAAPTGARPVTLPATATTAGKRTLHCCVHGTWKAYRFSVAWTRIAPNGGTDWNEEGFAYYDTLVDALLEAGIEPYVTLYHWDLPQALEEKGGWRSEETARAFASYAAKMAEHFKGRVHQWFTFNEPACIVKWATAPESTPRV